MPTPALDLDELVDRLGGDREAVAEIIQIFIEDTPARIEEIRRGDPALTARAVHTIKGSAGNLVAIPASEAAAALEQAMRHGDEAAVEAARARLLVEMDRLMADLSRARDVLTSGGGS